METAWYAKKLGTLLTELGSSDRGLSKNEAARRLEEHGGNQLPEAKVDSLPLIFLRQFQSPLIYILVAAALIILLIGAPADAAIIIAVLLFNAAVGTVQEGKAQNTLLALKKFSETKTTVVRDGEEFVIVDKEVVPGDIVLLREGEKIPADGRIVDVHNLAIDEAALTGESLPVHKVTNAIHRPNLPLPEQRNMMFKGTHVVAGNGKAIVTATGGETVIGNIAKQIAVIDTEIPLKASIRRLSRAIIVGALGISIFLVVLGVSRGATIKEMFVTAVALSVSIIPEGLPIAMTLVLATGVWRMSKKSALVKKLDAVEALGQAKIIAVDKTGTITKNELVVQAVFVNDTLFAIGGSGYDPNGEVTMNGNIVEPLNHPELLLMGKAAAYCASARVVYSRETTQWMVSGDPTEAALLVFGKKIGFHKDELEQESPLITELPFDYTTKYHVTIHRSGDTHFLAAVGAPEVLLNLSSAMWHNGKLVPLAAKEKARLEETFAGLSADGLRVLALATYEETPKKRMSLTKLPPLTFVGFYGMKDALRPEVHGALERAREAGMRVVMMTGDHRNTAIAIGRDAGIYRDGDEVLVGDDILSFDEATLAERVAKTSVFARVTPEHKLKIIQAFRRRGEIIAMTGDGVNDAASLVAADLGVAMGITGTEVAKEAADIVLLDDNFGTIITAVEEGRNIYTTIKKVLLYLFSTSLGEVFTIIAAIYIGYPLPILPAQIIWLNFVTDGFFTVALAMEPKEEGLIQEPYTKKKRSLVDAFMTTRMIPMALVMMAGSLFVFHGNLEHSLLKAQTMALVALAIFQWFNAWNCRSERRSVFQSGGTSNRYLISATLAVLLLQIFAVHNPTMQRILGTTSLSLVEWLTATAVASSILFTEELRKVGAMLLRRRVQ